jgi:hypothetical protein
VYALEHAGMSGDLLYDRAPRLPTEHFTAFTDGAEIIPRLGPKLVISIIERSAYLRFCLDELPNPCVAGLETLSDPLPQSSGLLLSLGYRSIEAQVLWGGGWM